MARIDRREQMKRLVKKWRASGQTKAAFVRAHGVSRGRLEYWVRRLGEGESSGGGRRQRPVNLIPVQVRDTASGSGGEIEILLGSGDRLRVSAEVRAEALRRVIEVLRGAC